MRELRQRERERERERRERYMRTPPWLLKRVKRVLEGFVDRFMAVLLLMVCPRCFSGTPVGDLGDGLPSSSVFDTSFRGTACEQS
jgi:hypothetical protein